ncbi:LytR/AlgR family response regulator transcription factor [Dyadobacter psychrotolerans]|uniref:Response regulator transcription factor n=1 Tax=Dyadobacter psychrotolerans TaxID=2541721 RepID=A0A4R5DWH1_9BACT|nr:LytTR family DNA-binding domain-containing protein [Dyadobacter psychrotolerans]TDE18237.1 response regulator transcription factor [Dyadobacter psychrotolerans]
MNLRCLIVDDEQAALNVLTNYISKTPFLELAGAFTDPIAALEVIYKEQIDIVFLDIHMPEISGLEWIKLLRGKSKVILTTAYSQYALDGYNLDVVDYLLKPVPFDRFLHAVQKVQDILTVKPIATPEPVPVPVAPAASSDHVFVKVDSKIMKVRFQDILYIEGLGNYVSIFTETGRLVTLSTMKEVEEYLSDTYFMRVHRSYIIAFNRVEYIEGNQIFLNKNTNVPLGETYRERFFKLLEESMMNRK